jgi:hypothetical protein
MGYRYEYEEVDKDLFDEFEDLVGAYLQVYRCTIYDEDTDEELAEGLGHSESDAKFEAEKKL